MGVQNLLPTVNGDQLSPLFNELDVDEWLPVVQINLVSKDQSAPISKRSLTLLAKDLRTRLQQIGGVKEVLILGNENEQFILSLDGNRLEQHRITLQEVVQAMRQSGTAPPAGTLSTDSGEKLIRVDSRYRNRNDLLTVVVRRDGFGNDIIVADLINHEKTGIKTFEGTAISSINGLDTVACKVLKEKAENVISINNEVKKIVDFFIAHNSKSNVEAIINLDSTVKIRDGLGVLVNSLALSIIFVLVLLFLFMTQTKKRITLTAIFLSVIAAVIVGIVQVGWIQGVAIGVLTVFVFINCRSAVLTISGIVFSFLGSLCIFYLTKQSINEISLLGFVLVSGIIVDDAIVIIENIQRHRENGELLMPAVLNGTSEMFWPVISASLTTVAAFLPMLLMTGSTGDFFALVPISVAASLGISLVESLIILPLHVVELERVLGPVKQPIAIKSEKGEAESSSGAVPRITKYYDKSLKWTLSHPLITVSFSGFLFFLAAGILIISIFGTKPILKLVFFPDDTSVVVVTIRMPPATPLQKTDQVVRKVGRYLDELGPDKVANASGVAGMRLDSSYNPVWSNQFGFLFVELPSRDDRSYKDPNKFISELRQEIENKFEEGGIDIELTAAKDGPPIGLPVNVRITGLEDGQILETTEDLLKYMRNEAVEGGSLHGVIDLTHSRNLYSTVMSFHPDRQRLAIFGLKESEVQQFIADAFDGAYVGDFRRTDTDIPIRARLLRSNFEDPLNIANLLITNDENGRMVRVGDIGEIRTSREAATLIKRDFQRTVTITGNISENARIGATNVVSVVSNWYKENGKRYPGISIAFGGESESTGKSYRSLITAFGLAVLLIYAILAAQFRSYLQPFLIMSNIIFSFTGVILVMAIFGIAAQALPEGWIRNERSYFTVQGFIAIIGLTGLVVNDAIILINFINKRLAEGLPLETALLTAGHQRMRPILMTTITTIAGLSPMAIGIPDFSITWSPFATCFIAGLSVSTTMTLLVVPVLYLLLNRITSGFSKFWISETIRG